MALLCLVWTERKRGKLSGSRENHYSTSLLLSSERLSTGGHLLRHIFLFRKIISNPYRAQPLPKPTEAGALRSSDVARSSKRRHLGASWPSPLESACRAGSSVSVVVGWKFLPVYLHLYAKEGDKFPSMRAKISRPMMGKNYMIKISSHVRSSYSSSCTYLESMPAPSSRQD